MSRTESNKSSASSLEGEDRQEIIYGEDHLTAVVTDKFGNEILIWPEGFLESENGSVSEYEQDIGSVGPESSLRIKQFWGEDNETFQFYYKGQQEEGEEEEEQSAEEEEPQQKRSIEPQESRVRSLFAHSSPTTFHDMNNTRKSVFGSIFLKTTHVNEEAALLRTVTETNYSMLHSLLSSCEKILCESPATDRRQMTIALRDSILKMLETHGIARIYSDGSFHWDIYPIAQSYLFVVQIGDHIHQTRNLTKVEDRIITGTVQTLRFPYGWPTDSLWSGHWDILGMAGAGSYVMPHGVSYNGKMKDGLFHDENATLTYPNKFKAIHCVYEKGQLINCQFQYPDTLIHEKENWAYCKFPDRRFWSEVRNGLQPAKTAQKTELDPPRKIPPGSYDTNNGFYNPKTLMLSSPNGDLVRIPVCEEDIWIKKYCRKGFFEYTDFRPDLFENWFSQKVIDSVLAAQEDFRRQRISYNDLQQIYASLGLLSNAVYKKQKNAEKAVIDENNLIPEPRVLNYPRKLKKFQGHHIPHVSKPKLNEEEKTPGGKASAVFKRSKSSLRFNNNGKSKGISVLGVPSRSSKINFKLGDETLDSQSKDTGSFQSSPKSFKRKIPDYIMQHQPILRGPFQELKKIFMQQEWGKKSPSSDYFDEDPWSSAHEEKEEKAEEEEELQQEAEESFTSDAIKKAKLMRFMKSIIMGKVNEILLQERKRERARMAWGAKIASESRRASTDKNTCLRDLREFFSSVPERDEYCDSFENSTCQLKMLAVDRYNMVKFWGKRMYFLEMESESSKKE